MTKQSDSRKSKKRCWLKDRIASLSLFVRNDKRIINVGTKFLYVADHFPKIISVLSSYG